MAEIKLQKRYKCAGDIMPVLLDIGFDLETASDFLNSIPDADVVPREEVDFLKKTIAENAQKALEVTLEEVENTKSEVAAEIFEEIEDLLREWFDFFRQDDCIRESCAIMAALSQVTERKKKYTEGEK